MNHDAIGSGRRHQLVLIAVVVAIFVLSGGAYAQQTRQATAKKVPTVDDYSRWRSISDREISGNGAQQEACR